MLDNILNTVKRSAERVQRRGEEVAQVARLKMEVFQLTRELDGHYARLGRAYHAGAELDLLQGVREDIRRTEEDIRARERLIDELGVTPDEAAGHEQPEQSQSQPGNSAQILPGVPQVQTSGAATPPSNFPAATTGMPLVTPPNSTLSNSPQFTGQPGDANSAPHEDS
ncbi:hypothetical protein [Deinococcus sp.]|uniref:hypothetical protein n=1 Tax=Deinococcus sp. TaxID=47478 RepID=UPI0025C52EC7|nr:hypothetical protein [Deinococcus sp.]